MRGSRSLLGIAAVAFVVTTTRARAEEPSWFVPEGERTKTIALEMNPLGITIGRFGANIEYMLAPHHAVIISPHYYFALPGVADQFDGPGVEAGYRYYTGANGPIGWFLGGNLSFGSYRYRHMADVAIRASDNVTLDGPVDNTWQSIGASIDAGYQILLREHLVLGGGLGVEYKYYTSDPGFEFLSHPKHDLLYGAGLRPRVLCAAGGVF
jgi:hypothetical protein